jgi:hypothetical protein
VAGVFDIELAELADHRGLRRLCLRVRPT